MTLHQRRRQRSQEEGVVSHYYYYWWLPLLALLLTLLTPTSVKAQQQGNNVDNNNICPKYRRFDESLSALDQYNAPDGCLCVDDMSGLNCGFCDSDGPCRDASNGTDYCRGDTYFAFGEDDTYKAYSCTLTAALEAAFTNGKVSIYMDLIEKSANFVIYNLGTINDDIAVDCRYWDCEFGNEASSPTNAYCASSECSCGWQCSFFVQSVIEGMLSGQPAELVVDPSTRQLDLLVDGSPIAIQAICDASACVPDPNNAGLQDGDNNMTAIEILDDDGTPTIDENDKGNEWTIEAGLSILILVVVFGAFLLLTLATYLPHYLISKYSNQSRNKNNKNNNSQNNLPRNAMETAPLTEDAGDDHAVEESTPTPPPPRPMNCLTFSQITSVVPTKKKKKKKKKTNQKDHTENDVDEENSNNQNENATTTTTTNDDDKIILNNVSGSAKSGSILGIMGPSGAGKTSLLKILAAAGNNPNTPRTTGHVLWNGRKLSNEYRRNVARYVPQEDVLYDSLTVRECLEYSALLRSSHKNKRTKSPSSKQQQVMIIQEKVDKTMEDFHLTSIANSRVAQISGGERKRVAIGMELVPQLSSKVLLLDEPTSGLDSFAASNIMALLKELASSPSSSSSSSSQLDNNNNSNNNCMIILSIHQPSMKSFLLMDQILLLANGTVTYNGSPKKVKAYLQQQGFPNDKNRNKFGESIADYMLEIVSDTNNVKVLAQTAASNATKDSNNNNNKDKTDDPSSSKGQKTMLSRRVLERPSLFREIAILYVRTAKSIFRTRTLFLLQLTISILMALFAGAIFHDVSNNLAGFQNRMGAFYFTLSFFGFASFSSMDTFFKERSIFFRESGSYYHRCFSYFLVKTVLDLFLLRVIPITIFTFVFYWIMGLKNEVSAFVIFWAALVLFNLCAGVMSICISIAAPTVGVANLVAAVWFLIMLLFGGFLVNLQTMSPSYAWIKYISIFYYTFEILITNELTGVTLSFDAVGYPELPVFGEVFLATIGMEADNQIRNFLCLAGLAIGCSILAYGLLLWLCVPPSVEKHVQQRTKNNKLYLKE